MDTPTLLNARYRVGPRIGTGGMADVHRATDDVLGRDVAVKLLRGTDADRDRFATEACTVAALNHPGIVTMLDAGLDEDRPYLVMELVDGPTLAQALADGPLDPERVRAIGEQLAAALAHAHAQGVVHRDVKPGNVLLRPDGSACLADFGIARIADGGGADTVTGMVVGSPAYVAPEQVAGEEVGPAADVYSLGLVLLEALTGRRAFGGTGVEVAYARVRSAPAIPVSLGPEWVGALTAMTARRPQERPTAAQVATTLGEEVVEPSYVDPEPTTPVPVRRAGARFGRAAAVVVEVVAAVATLAVLVVLASWPGGTSEPAGTADLRTPTAPTVPAAVAAVSGSPTGVPAPAAARVTHPQRHRASAAPRHHHRRAPQRHGRGHHRR